MFMLGNGEFDRSKNRYRRLEGPSRSAFRSIELAKIPNPNTKLIISWVFCRRVSQKIVKKCKLPDCSKTARTVPWFQSRCRMPNGLGPVRNFCVRVRNFGLVSGIGNFDRFKSRSRRLQRPSRSAFRSIKLAKIPKTNTKLLDS